MLTMQNTSGYTQAELDVMNAKVEALLAAAGPFTDDYAGSDAERAARWDAEKQVMAAHDA